MTHRWGMVVCAALLAAFGVPAAACGGGATQQHTDDTVEFEDERAARQAQGQHPASQTVQQGEAQLAQGHAPEAEALFRQAIHADAHDARAQLDLGLAREMQDDVHGAEQAYRAALAIDDEFPEALNDLGALQRDAGDLAGALETLHAALRARPGYPDAQMNLALALEDQGDAVGATAAYRAVLRVKPDAAQAHVNLGLLLLRTGHADEAAQELHTAQPLCEHSRALLAAIGSGLRQLGEPEAAVRALEGAVAATQDPPTPGLRSELALARLASHDQAGAERDLTALVHDEPRYAIAHYALAGVLATKGDVPGAVAQYQEYLRLEPNGDHAATAHERIDRLHTMSPPRPPRGGHH